MSKGDVLALSYTIQAAKLLDHIFLEQVYLFFLLSILVYKLYSCYVSSLWRLLNQDFAGNRNGKPIQLWRCGLRKHRRTQNWTKSNFYTTLSTRAPGRSSIVNVVPFSISCKLQRILKQWHHICISSHEYHKLLEATLSWKNKIALKGNHKFLINVMIIALFSKILLCAILCNYKLNYYIRLIHTLLDNYVTHH